MVYMKKMKAIITTFIEYICHLSKYPKGNMVKLAGTYSRPFFITHLTIKMLENDFDVDF